MENSSPILRFGQWFAAVIAVFAGSVSGFFLIPMCLAARATASWPSVPGVITKAEVGLSGDSHYYADVSYSYEVGRRDFIGHQVDRSNYGYNVREGSERALQGLAPGQSVIVYFDPHAPAQSVLRPGAGVQDYLLVLFPIATVGLGLAGIRSLLRGGARRSRMGAKTAIEHDFRDRTGNKAAKGGGHPIPIHRAIIGAWCDLLGSRESLLLRAYSESAPARDPEDFEPATVEEARQRFETMRGITFSSDSAMAAQEFQIVLATRLAAAWIVFWTTIPPAGILGWIIVLRIRHRVGFPDVQSFAQFLIGSILGFLFFGVVGLFVQAIFLRPYMAVVNRMIGSADGTDRAPIEDGSKDPNGGVPG